MIFLFFIFVYQMKIKLHDTESYLVYNGEDLELHLSDYDNSTEFKYEYNMYSKGYDNILVRHDENLAIGFNDVTDKFVLDISKNAIKIIAVPLEIYDRTYWLVYKNKCMQFDIESGTFSKQICDKKNKNQKFTLDCNDLLKESEILDIEDFDENDLHLSIKEDKKEYKNTEYSYEPDENNLTQALMEKHGHHIISNLHKLLYDFSSCILQKNICMKDIWLATWASIKTYSSSQKYSASSSKSSSSSYSSSGSASRSSSYKSG